MIGHPFRIALILVTCVASLSIPMHASAALPDATIFAPGVISSGANDGSPSFMPDGKTLFFTRSGARGNTVMQSTMRHGTWTPPIVAPFSGVWNDEHAFVAPSGGFVVFVSTRPVPGLAQRVAHVWRVDRVASGWSAAVHLPDAVNRASLIYAPSVAADGSIYFFEHR